LPPDEEAGKLAVHTPSNERAAFMIGESLLEHEPVIRLGAFFSLFAVMALWEIAQPQDGHVAMTIGLDVFREKRDERLDQMLIQPLRDTQGQYAINRRDWD
jgi:hypothetical protein